MASFTVRVGVILVILGVASYVMTGATSLTALIPSLFGAALALCGVSSRQGGVRSVPLRVAIAIAGVGFVGTVTAIGQLGTVMATTGGSARPAVVARASMALVLLVYLAFATRAFVREALGRSRR